MENEITTTDNKNLTVTETKIQLSRTISEMLGMCYNCPNATFCQEIAEKRKEIEFKVDAETAEALLALNKIGTSLEDKEDRKEAILTRYDTLRDRKVTSLLRHESEKSICAYEKQIAEDTLADLLEKYPYQDNKHVYYIIEQIIKLKLHDFRLAMAHKKYGVITDMSNGRGMKLQLTPGLHYSLEIAEHIGKLIEQIDNIVNKIKQEDKTEYNTVNVYEVIQNTLMPNKEDRDKIVYHNVKSVE